MEKKKLTRKKLTDEFKLSVLRDFYASGMSKSACVKKYGLTGGVTQLSQWIKKFDSGEKGLTLPLETIIEEDMSRRTPESYKEENAQLKKRIKELEKALSFSRLETEARDLMITRAEEYFNIPIRKKSGAK